MEFKINKIIEGYTKTSERRYLQVYIQVEDGLGLSQEHSFFASGSKMKFWEDTGIKIQSRDEMRLAEIEEEMEQIKNRNK